VAAGAPTAPHGYADVKRHNRCTAKYNAFDSSRSLMIGGFNLTGQHHYRLKALPGRPSQAPQPRLIARLVESPTVVSQ